MSAAATLVGSQTRARRMASSRTARVAGGAAGSDRTCSTHVNVKVNAAIGARSRSTLFGEQYGYHLPATHLPLLPRRYAQSWKFALFLREFPLKKCAALRSYRLMEKSTAN